MPLRLLDICATESPVGSTFADAVNVCDMVAIQRYILGIAPFSLPYRVLASDLNMSGLITDMDIFSLRQALMGHYDLELVPAPPLNTLTGLFIIFIINDLSSPNNT
jgi:hypothetical protein